MMTCVLISANCALYTLYSFNLVHAKFNAMYSICWSKIIIIGNYRVLDVLYDKSFARALAMIVLWVASGAKHIHPCPLLFAMRSGRVYSIRTIAHCPHAAV